MTCAPSQKAGAFRMRPYVIWSPPFDHRVGGIRALYALRDGLRARGLDAHMHDERTDPDAITVYPEIVTDNPLGAARIVRWRLNKANIPSDGLVYDWAPTGDGSPLLTFDLIDHEQLARRETPRSGVVLVVHKGLVDRRLVPPGAVEITPTWPPVREQTIDLLAGAEHVVSFDEFTMLNLEAVLLGTPVVLYPTGRWSLAEMHRADLLAPGICFRTEDLHEAGRLTTFAWPWYRRQVDTYPALLDQFIEETQARWPSSG